MSEAQLPNPATWPGHTGNWNRWPNDLGTLNLVTPEVTRRGIGSVATGQVVSLSRPVTDREPIRGDVCFEHTMLSAGAWDLEPDRPESLNSADQVAYRTHGMVNTHLDALAHVGHDGKGFNGIDFDDLVTKEDGVKRASISNARAIVTRGVLIDVARSRRVSHLHPGEFVRPEEVESAASELEPGDAALIRTGATLEDGLPPTDDSCRHGTWQGLHPECVEVLGGLDVSVLATDCGGRRVSLALRTHRALARTHALPRLLRHPPAAQHGLGIAQRPLRRAATAEFSVRRHRPAHGAGDRVADQSGGGSLGASA